VRDVSGSVVGQSWLLASAGRTPGWLSYAPAMTSLLFLSLSTALAADAAVPQDDLKPVIIAHRGASGHRPEHTFAAYALGVQMGADYIEPDLVPTADGKLVARHDLDLQHSTDAATVWAGRSTTRAVDGQTLTGWFTDDFTLAEVQQLKARQPRDDRSKEHDGQHAVPTWSDILAWAAAQPRPIGLAPELKHPTHLRARGHDPVAPFLADLAASGFPHERVWVQCFDVGPLKELDAASDLRLVQLIGHPLHSPADGGPTYGEMLTRDGLTAIATYADAIGVHKMHLLPVVEGAYAEPSTVVEDAHAVGLEVHVYTFRDEASERPPEEPSATSELKRFFSLGVDAIFSDHPDTAVAARRSP